MKRSLPLFLVILLGILASAAQAQIGNAWHVPTNTVPNSSSTMRAPLNNFDPGSTITIYSGNQFQGAGNPGNQSGGSVFYKSATGSYHFRPARIFHPKRERQVLGRQLHRAFARADPVLPPDQLHRSLHDLSLRDRFHQQRDSRSRRGRRQPLLGDLNPTLTVNGVSANYTMSHVFVDEIAGDSVPFTVVFNPNAANVDPTTVQVFTNLNRRDYATLPYVDSNGIATEEGIHPPSGDLVGTNDSHYYKAYLMAASGGQYSLTLNTANAGPSRTGAYRLTARYRTIGSSTWQYYTSNGRRDHAIVVSPKAARNINLYEINTLNINATGDQMAQRSTFADLHNSSEALESRLPEKPRLQLSLVSTDSPERHRRPPDRSEYRSSPSPSAVLMR